MTSGVFMPFQALRAFSPQAQAEFAAYVRGQLGIASHDDAEAAEGARGEEDGPSDLSVAQARKFLDRVSDKVRATLRVIAESDPAGFELAQVMQALNVGSENDLRGVWGGITKRVRSVLSDDQAYLIWWDERGHSWIGRVSAMTHNSLRKALGL